METQTQTWTISLQQKYPTTGCHIGFNHDIVVIYDDMLFVYTQKREREREIDIIYVCIKGIWYWQEQHHYYPHMMC